jgi:L-lactate dehydrogenase complex protein LldG
MPAAEIRKEVPATSWAGRAARFRARAIAASATVAEVAAADGVAAEVRRYLASLGLPPEVRISAAPPGLSAGLVDGLRCDAGAPRPDGDTLVTGCFAAVAGEGVVVLASGPAHAPESAFLAATHVVVVEPAQLVDSLESLWARLRGLVRPRMLNLVLGPSRTADLGVPSRLGAHGPLRVHVILITGED